MTPITPTGSMTVGKGYGRFSMSDLHEMYENWVEGGYDPAYVGEEPVDELKPVGHDDWATNDDFGEGE
jgi:hypothetical protein